MKSRLKKRTVLITGANGQLGTELQRCRWPKGWTIRAVDRSDLDLSDPKAIADMIEAGGANGPYAAVINAAAYTAVDRAESDALAAWQINALAPLALATACAKEGIPIVQVSTDYVFAGDKQSAWEVDDHTNPINVYGASKLSGELAVRTSGARHAIVRTAWLVSAHGQNFVKTMLRLAAERPKLRVVSDQYGSPTAASDLAAALVKVTMQLAQSASASSGIFHFSNSGTTTWANLAMEVLRQSSERGGPTAVVEPITTADYPTPAKRPSNSMLGLTAIEASFGIVPRPWQEAVTEIVDDMIGLKQ